jgi:hypothetical protein
MNEKESIIKVLKSKPSDSSIEKAEQITSKMTEKNMEEKESTTKETNTRSQHKAIDKITKTDVQKEKNSKMILDQISTNEVLVNIGTERKNEYNMCAEAEMAKSVTVQEDNPSIADILDLTNVWLDKYKYNDAENQFYQQLDEQNKMIGNKSKKTDEKEEKNKSKVVFEIFEEIIEHTDITYHLVKKDAHMKEKLKEFESKNNESKQYLCKLSSYVKSLERRVKTLEGGQKKAMGERSSSLYSNTSDEGVDLVGGTQDFISGYKLNEKKYFQDEVQDLLPRKKNMSLS